MPFDIVNVDRCKKIIHTIYSSMSYKGFDPDDSNLSSFSLTKGNGKLKKDVETFDTTPTPPTLDTLKADAEKYNSLQGEYIAAATTHYNELLAGGFNNNRNNIKSNTYNSIYTKPSLIDARMSDENDMIVQQNYLYILGTITLAIVLVGSIVIVKQ